MYYFRCIFSFYVFKLFLNGQKSFRFTHIFTLFVVVHFFLHSASFLKSLLPKNILWYFVSCRFANNNFSQFLYVYPLASFMIFPLFWFPIFILRFLRVPYCVQGSPCLFDVSRSLFKCCFPFPSVLFWAGRTPNANCCTFHQILLCLLHCFLHFPSFFLSGLQFE